MRVRFWGTRGSIATPGPSTVRFGGNTLCVELITNKGERLIFDCGTGARPLGLDLNHSVPRPLRATILLSHTHWDHIQGFPILRSSFRARKRIHHLCAGGRRFVAGECALGANGVHLLSCKTRPAARKDRFSRSARGTAQHQWHRSKVPISKPPRDLPGIPHRNRRRCGCLPDRSRAVLGNPLAL